MSDASKIDKADVVAIFAEAFAKWATALSLRFKFVSPEQNSVRVSNQTAFTFHNEFDAFIVALDRKV